MKWLTRAFLLTVVLLVVGAGFAFLPMLVDRLGSPEEVTLAGGVKELADGFVNVFLVQSGPEEVVLFDCGNDREATVIRAELVRLGLGAAAVKAIFLTHGHRDHLGGCRAFPEASLHALEEERDLVEGRAAPRGPLGPSLAGRAGDRAIPVSEPLADGQLVSVGSVSVQAFALPGHTRGSAAYLVNGVLLLGDAATASREGGIRPAEWAFSEDRAAAIASLRALAARLEAGPVDVQAVAFSHSGPLDSLAPLLEWAHRP
jgi:glyoxylase-like metal-dependent hydrolase (beta-lactamase superfamily II)